MKLPNYGMLKGTLTHHGDQAGGNPHYLLFIQAGAVTYRVAVNLQSALAANDAPPELEYQILDLAASERSAVKALVGTIQTQSPGFMLEDQNAGLPTLDFVRGGLLDMRGFTRLPRGTNPEDNPYYQALVAAAGKAQSDGNVAVAVFGTGYGPHDDRRHGQPGDPRRASFGFTGVDNIHMNQGNYHQVGTHINSHFSENGPNQDGAVIFFFEEGAIQGFFSKFQSQDNETDEYGNPVHTGIRELDAIPAQLRSEIAPPNPFRYLSLSAGPLLPSASAASSDGAAEAHAAPDAAARHVPAGDAVANVGAALGPAQAAVPGPAPASSGFVFASPGFVPDPNRQFKEDNDSAVRNSPFVANFAKLGVPEPVPGPRNGQYPTLSLDRVLLPETITAIRQSRQIVFHSVGDTGAASAQKLPEEVHVADLMLRDFKVVQPQDLPAFFFHLGDVVYYYGEQEYYYDQFYKPYKDYPAPIFAIPGNHDGITYNKDMVSLDGFIQAFCADQPGVHWEGAGGIGRTSMIQPGVFFTLDAPFVSIIGLYSNCSESYGYLDAQQKLFLYNELVRLKAKRDVGEIAAVLLAVHHSPLSYSPSKPSSGGMRDAIDLACTQADFWPDAFLSGHAHVYQRMTRTMTVGGASREIPYIISGSGGYAVNARQELDVEDFKLQDVNDPQFRLHRFLAHFGYLQLTVQQGDPAAMKPGTLRVEFRSPGINAGRTADACVLNLDTHQML